MIQRRIRGLAIALAALAIGGPLESAVRAQPGDDLIVEEIGEGFNERDIEFCIPAADGGQSRAFVGELGTVCVLREAPLDPAEVALHVETQRDPSGIDFSVGDTSPAVAQIFDADTSNPVYAVSFGVGPYFYTIYFIRSVVEDASFNPERFVADLVQDHVDLAAPEVVTDSPEPEVVTDSPEPEDVEEAPAPTTADQAEVALPSPDVDAELASLVGDVDGFVRATPPIANVHLAGDIEGVDDISVALTDGTTSVLQVYGDDEGLFLGVLVSRYRFPLFAAAALGDRSALGTEEGIHIPADDPRPDLAAIIDESGQITGAAFRQGPVFYLVETSAPDDIPPRQVADAVERLATSLYDVGPGGDTGPFSFASPRQAVIQTALLTAGLVLVVLLVRRLLSRRARRVGAAHLGRDNLVFVDAEAAAIRGRSRVFVGVQLVVLSTIAVALAVVRGPVAWVLSGAALVVATVAGIIVRRLDRGRAGGRFVAPAVGGLVGGLLAIIVLVAGAALLIRGVSTWLFTPWLDHLELSARLRIEPTRLSQLMVAVGFGLGALGGVALRSARRLGRGSAGRARKADPRPDVLYLRSFDDDDRRIPTVHSSRRPFLEVFSLRGTEPFEECIAWQLQAYGPVIAITPPDGSNTSLGASRERIGTDWQGGLLERMSRAEKIVIVIGKSEGLRWEIGQIVRENHLDKTIIVVPPVDDDEIRSRWASFCDVAGAAGHPMTTPLDPAGALALKIDRSGAMTGFTAGRRDEAAYRAALDAAAAQSPPRAAVAAATFIATGEGTSRPSSPS